MDKTDKMCLMKRLYLTFADAEQALKRRQKKAKIKLRIYKCPICKGYHLTSKEAINE